jgi:hypothetical protein
VGLWVGISTGTCDPVETAQAFFPRFAGKAFSDVFDGRRVELSAHANTARLIRPMKTTAMKMRCGIAIDGLLLAAHRGGHVVGVL